MHLLQAVYKSDLEPIAVQGASSPELSRALMAWPTYIIKSDADWPQIHREPVFVRYFYLPCISGALADLDPKCKAPCRRFIVMGNGGGELCLR